MLDWLVRALGLPEKFLSSSMGGGVIQDSVSSGTLCALIAAREKITGGRYRAQGGSACPRLVAYASDQAHSSLVKGAMVCGVGASNVRLVPTDPATQALSVPALEAQVGKEEENEGGGGEEARRECEKAIYIFSCRFLRTWRRG